MFFFVFIENRSSIDNNQTIIGNSNTTSTQPQYSPLTFFNKPSSSSDASLIWNPVDSLNSSFSSTSSNSDYGSVSSLHGSEMKSNSNFTTTTTNDLSMIYNPNHQTIIQEEYTLKRESLPQLNGTPPSKKKPRNDDLSALPTPPPSSGYSSAAEKMMVTSFLFLHFSFF
jgi:hypothetical protein